MRIRDWSSDVCSSDLHVQHVSWLESSALADFKVVEVVTRRDLHRARTKFRIGMLVGDDGDKASGNRQAHLLANQRLISRIFRIHSYGHVGPHGFRPSRGDTDVPRSIFPRITEVTELALPFLPPYLPVTTA